jgi:hypothetical protein
MSEFQAVAATLTSIKAAGDLVSAFLDVRGAIQEQGKVFELQRVILAAHQSALASQEAQASLQERIRGLEKQISDFEIWNSEKTRYELVDVGSRGSVFAFRLKPEARGAEPLHLLCARCFEGRKRSILQATTELRMALRVHNCPECGTDYTFSRIPEPPTQDKHEFEYDPLPIKGQDLG